MKKSLAVYPLYAAAAVVVFLVCAASGSVAIPLAAAARVIRDAALGRPPADPALAVILLSVRIPRVLCAALAGAALSLSGAAMQGLLKNPLASESTLGVSAGASLGACLALLGGLFAVQGGGGGGLTLTVTITAAAILAAFLSLLLILFLAWRLDYSLSTNTIILLGVIYQMFASSLLMLIITFAGEKMKQITFWTMGSFAGCGYGSAALLALSLLTGGTVLLSQARELNAFAVGEDNARHVGVDTRRVKLTVLVCVSVLTGVCVSVSGSIGFVGLVVPHITRLLTGPNHKRLLPACVAGGAVFLMLADLASRLLFSPRELPIGVVTSFAGALLFVYIFSKTRRGKR